MLSLHVSSLQVGSVNPAENFRTLVQKKTIPFDQGEIWTGPFYFFYLFLTFKKSLFHGS